MAQYNRGTTRTATFMSRRKQNTEEFEPHDMNVAVQQQGVGPGLLVGATHSSKKKRQINAGLKFSRHVFFTLSC